MRSEYECALARGWMILCLVLASLLPGCRTSQRGEAPRSNSQVKSQSESSSGVAAKPRATSAARAPAVHPPSGDVVVGQAVVFENLTVFPILARSQIDVGPVATLDAALETGTAEVRELGTEDPTEARVGTLVLENRGDVPIYVLGGTVVKGGRQDRQIAQDFIVAPHTTVSVDAFCVEHGRWAGKRRGVDTNGKFRTGRQLATSEVRMAAQYEQDQSKVWAQVGKINRENQKQGGTGSLFATLDDVTVTRQRDALAARIAVHLANLKPAESVVGFAYAVDGEVRAVRWFAHHRIFMLFVETLANTSALDAITARGGRPPQTPPALEPRVVTQFIAEVDASRNKEERATAAENVNEYSRSRRGYGSKTRYRPAPKAAEVEVSSDYAFY